MKDQELYHLGPATEATSRPARPVNAILDDGDLEIVTVGGGPAGLVHVPDPPSSDLKQ